MARDVDHLRRATGRAHVLSECGAPARTVARILGRSRLCTDQRGIAMIGVLLLTAVMLAMAIFGSRTAQVETQIARNDLLAKRALAVAEAGVHHALSLVKADVSGSGFTDGFDDELSGGGTGGALTALGNLATLEGDSYRFRAFGGRPEDGYYVRAADDFDELVGADDPTVDTNLRVRLISHGRVGSAERVVEVVVANVPLFTAALFGDDSVSVTSGLDTDSYDSRVGPYPNGPGNGGDAGSNGNIVIDAFYADINGDARAAGTVTVVHGVVMGDIVNGAAPIALAPVAPCGPPYSPAAGIRYKSDGTTVSSPDYDPATGVLAPLSDIVLAAGAHCFSAVTLNHVLEVSGPVTMSVTGAADLRNGTIVNPGDPSDFLVLSSYSGAGDGVAVKGGASARAGIYAPRAQVRLTGGADWYGAVVGKTVIAASNGNFHYDEALTGLPGPNVAIANWREVRDY